MKDYVKSFFTILFWPYVLAYFKVWDLLTGHRGQSNYVWDYLNGFFCLVSVLLHVILICFGAIVWAFVKIFLA